MNGPAIELRLLVLAVIVGLVQLVWTSVAAQPQRGLKWNLGPRDEPVVLTGVAGRLQRALANFLETFPFFAALVIVDYLAGKLSDLTAWGAWLYVVGRAVYAPLYASGVPGVRTIAWFVAMVGIVLLIVAFFLA